MKCPSCVGTGRGDYFHLALHECERCGGTGSIVQMPRLLLPSANASPRQERLRKGAPEPLPSPSESGEKYASNAL